MDRNVVCLGWMGVVLLMSQAATANDNLFHQRVAPLVMGRCLECHHSQNASGGLDLSTAESVRRGGESGPALVASKPGESLLLQRVRDGEMPPPKQGKPQRLTNEELETLQRWIASGAAWPDNRRLDLFETTTDRRGGRDWWSFQPIQRTNIPLRTTADAANGRDQMLTAVDPFIHQKLEEQGWSFGPQADRRSLLRRLYYDLVGLPPTFEEIESFLADARPDAYERIVDRLLASPRHGERWGRYWLDVVRFAETCGYERDQLKPFAWKYRDYVIRTLNEDRRFDRFVLEQLAGDELPERDEETLVATGFLRVGTWNDEPNDPNEYKYDRLEDMVHSTGAAFLGLTLKCARCHDHKFDPVSQVDYYRVANAFWAGFIDPGPRELLGGPDTKTLGRDDVFAWTDRSSNPPLLHLLKKGDPKHPGLAVEPGQLSLLPGLDRPVARPAEGARTTGRRMQLARWIVDPQNPLTARVWVNRIWLHHFGKGLVRSPDNFGFTGEKPTHPELLDWLSNQFISEDEFQWQTKPLHRLLVTSRTFRQSSLHPLIADRANVDANNRLWWRAERQRLDAEALRDSLLTVSGRLEFSKANGPSFLPPISNEAAEGLSRKSGAWKASPASEQGRRSVFMLSQRSLLPPLATVFDFPDTTLPCGQRDVTTVAPQALALLNNEFIHEQSERFAKRLLAELPSGPAGHPTQVHRSIHRAWQIVFGRAASVAELQAAEAHLNTQRRHFEGQEKLSPPRAEFLSWASLCHVLLNANEFIYVD